VPSCRQHNVQKRKRALVVKLGNTKRRDENKYLSKVWNCQLFLNFRLLGYSREIFDESGQNYLLAFYDLDELKQHQYIGI